MRENMQEQLEKLLCHKKSRQFYANRLGISVEEVKDLLSKIKGLDVPEETKNSVVGVDTNLGGESMKMTFHYDHAPTAEEVIAEHNLDLKNWKLDRFWSLRKGKGWLVSALFVAIRKEEKQVNDFAKFLETYKAPKLEIQTVVNTAFDRPCMVELNIADLHIDKRGHEGETFDELGEKYYDIIETLLHRVYFSHQIEEITFIVGNDFLTSDNFQSQVTSQSNVQEVNERWDVSYEKGFDLMVKTITMVKTFAEKVNIIVMQGNHARTREFYLGHALEVYFSNTRGITFDRSSAPRKIHVYNNTAIMFHHGNCKQEKLPLIMASEFPLEWGATKFHRVSVGDKHHIHTREIDGVIIQQFPSLSQTDTWHNENNFHLSGRTAICNVYDREKGIIAEYQEKI